MRLRYGYIITCVGVDKAADGTITALRCTYDPDSKGAARGRPSASRRRSTGCRRRTAAGPKCGSTIACSRASGPARGDTDFLAEINPGALEVLQDCIVEPSLANAAAETRFQFERLGYFVVDRDSTADRLVFNRTVTLRDQWAKINKAQTASRRREGA